jgi:GT2 family glycosyltransferase
MTVTTIIVNYNAGTWLERAVNSVLRETDGNLVIVDNASTDSSLAMLQFSAGDKDRVSVICNDRNLGFAHANNQALTSVTTDYVILMNPDCEMSSGCWSEILKVMAKEERIGLASCVIRNADGSLQTTCRRRFPTPWSAAVHMLALNRLFPRNQRFRDFDYGDMPLPESWEAIDAISGAFMVTRVSALAEVGFMDDAYFMHCEDLDWCMRFQLAGYVVAFVPHAEVVHAKGVSSQSRPVATQWNLHRGMLRFFDKFYRQQYAWPLRWFVTAGIYVSFLWRALKVTVSGLLR